MSKKMEKELHKMCHAMLEAAHIAMDTQNMDIIYPFIAMAMTIKTIAIDKGILTEEQWDNTWSRTNKAIQTAESSINN